MSRADGTQGGGGGTPTTRTVVAYVVGLVVALGVMYFAALLLGIGGLFALDALPAASGLLLLLAVLLVPGSGIYAGVKVARYVKREGRDPGDGATEDRPAGADSPEGVAAAERIGEVADALTSVSRDLPASRAALDRAERYLDHDAGRVARQTADRVDRMVYVERILRAAVEGARERPTSDDRVEAVAASLAEAERVAGYDVDGAAELLERALAEAAPLAETLRQSARHRADRAEEAARAGDAARARGAYDRAIDRLEAAMDLETAAPVGGDGGDGPDGDGGSGEDPSPGRSWPDGRFASGVSGPDRTGSTDGDGDPDGGDRDADRLKRWRSERARLEAEAGPERVRDTERA